MRVKSKKHAVAASALIAAFLLSVGALAHAQEGGATISVLAQVIGHSLLSATAAGPSCGACTSYS